MTDNISAIPEPRPLQTFDCNPAETSIEAEGARLSKKDNEIITVLGPTILQGVKLPFNPMNYIKTKPRDRDEDDLIPNPRIIKPNQT